MSYHFWLPGLTCDGDSTVYQSHKLSEFCFISRYGLFKDKHILATAFTYCIITEWLQLSENLLFIWIAGTGTGKWNKKKLLLVVVNFLLGHVPPGATYLCGKKKRKGNPRGSCWILLVNVNLMGYLFPEGSICGCILRRTFCRQPKWLIVILFQCWNSGWSAISTAYS